MPILKRLLSYCLALALFAVTGVADAEQKTAVVDSQRVVLETEEGLRVQATLRKLFDARQLELDRKQNELQKEREALEKQRNVLSQAVLAQRTEKWQKDVAAVQQQFAEYSKELQRKQSELTQPMLARITDIVKQLARKEGFHLVVEKQTAIYVGDGLDLTDRVIQLYNQAATPAKPPAPAKK
ncbi:MAG TPA: OmpH family outer membrane protein [Polyangiaceae bacterium]|nr:OmpH family outer membrane protein [Polyangiaceae bacterium]